MSKIQKIRQAIIDKNYYLSSHAEEEMINDIRFNGGDMICEYCEGQTVKKKVKKHHRLHGKLYIIENIEAEVCKECGERYFHAKILDGIDRILETKHDVKEKIEVEVVTL